VANREGSKAVFKLSRQYSTLFFVQGDRADKETKYETYISNKVISDTKTKKKKQKKNQKLFSHLSFANKRHKELTRRIGSHAESPLSFALLCMASLAAHPVFSSLQATTFSTAV